MFNKGTNIFLKSGVAPQVVLAAQLLANQIASQLAAENSKTNYHGRMKRGHKRLTNGTPSTTFVRRTRQMERSEGRAEIKAMERRMKQRERDSNAIDLEQRKGARLERELARRDARFGVHAIIERGRFGALSRRQLA